MDHTEDLSARVLLRQILSTEEPRTPITRSVSQAERSSGTRRSDRLSKKNAEGQTPQDILRRSLRHKMRESITRKSLPATTRRTTSSSVLRKANTPGPASMLFDDGDTPRHILRNIVRTEPVRSPVVHKRPASEGPQLLSANSSIASKRPSTEFSGLDLPDLTIATALSTVKGLSRKRPRRSFNVTAFENRLKDGNDASVIDVEEENEESISDHSSLSLSSSTSLSLKTPFVDVRTERKGLQRKVPNRRKITVEDFGAAVDRWQTGSDHGVSSFAPVEQAPNETTCPDGFTLGLSELSEPDVTTDIVNCNTALYTHPDATAASFFNVATQDKPTVMTSQLQRQMEVEQSKLGKDNSVYAFPTEEEHMAEPQNEECALKLQMEKDEDSAQCEEEERKSTDDHAESQPCPSHGTSKSEEEQNKLEGQMAEEAPADPYSEGDVASRSQSEENDVVPDPQTEAEEEGGDDGDDSQPEEDVAARSQSEEEEVAAETRTEEEEDDAVDSQSAEDGEAKSQSEEAEGLPGSPTGAEEEVAAESQTEKEDNAVDSQSEEDGEAKSQSEEDRDLAESQDGDHYDGNQEEGEVEQVSEQLEHDLEHISRRVQRSEGRLIVPVTEAGWSGDKSGGHSATDLHSSVETGSPKSSQPQVGMPDPAVSSPHGQEGASFQEAQPDAEKENSFRQLQASHDIEDGDHLHNATPEGAAAEAPAEQEEEWEDEEAEEEEEDDEESEEKPLKTPAFVREKRNFFQQQDPQASPVLKTIQVSGTGTASPAAKRKQVQRKRRPAKKEGALPKNYLMGVFKHFAKTKVSPDVYPVLKEIMDKFFDRLADDLETYAGHAKRKTIDVEDAVLLLKRQGYVNDKVPVEVLIEKYLRMEQRKLLIPIATSGNVVVPKKRR